MKKINQEKKLFITELDNLRKSSCDPLLLDSDAETQLYKIQLTWISIKECEYPLCLDSFDDPRPLPHAQLNPLFGVRYILGKMKKIRKNVQRFWHIYSSVNMENFLFDFFWYIYSSQHFMTVVKQVSENKDIPTYDAKKEVRPIIEAQRKVLFQRMALNFTELCMVMSGRGLAKQKDYYMAYFAKIVCRIVHFLYVFCFPKSRALFSQDWKLGIFGLLNNWIYGVKGDLLLKDKMLCQRRWLKDVTFSLIVDDEDNTKKDANQKEIVSVELKSTKGKKTKLLKEGVVNSNNVSDLLQQHAITEEDVIDMAIPQNLTPMKTLEDSLDDIDSRVKPKVEEEDLNIMKHKLRKEAMEKQLSHKERMRSSKIEERLKLFRIELRDKKWFEEGIYWQSYLKKGYTEKGNVFKPFSNNQSPFVRSYLDSLHEEKQNKRLDEIKELRKKSIFRTHELISQPGVNLSEYNLRRRRKKSKSNAGV